MHKHKIIYSLICIIILILLGGCVAQDNIDNEIASDIKEIATSYIENNYESIESIKLDEPYRGQMGSLTVDGTVNGNAGFSISFDENLNVSGIAEDESFPEEKKECRKQFCE
ncbi:hypothetical protein SFC02_16240 [Terribacillus goriensis]|uniref:hypothetical protein n=1 Tax=Terribacillus saccharophilus TaxID=361277 RepID=UPI003982EE6A